MSPRHSAKRSGPIFHTHGRTLPTQPSTALGVTAGTTHAALAFHRTGRLGSQEKRNSGGAAFPVAAALRTARRQTKSELEPARVGRCCAVPEFGSTFRGAYRALTSDPTRPNAAVTGNLQLNACGRENKCAPPSRTSAARPHPALAARTPPPHKGRC